MAAVSTMILRSLRLTGEKAREGTLSSDEQTQCLQEFNTFLDSCNNERLLCYQVQQDSLALTASTESYTIGIGGAFNVTRPTRIVDPCFVRDDATSTDTALTIINAESYGRIVDKTSGYTVPEYLFYDNGFSATSTGTLYLYPSPSPSLTLFINSWRQFSQVSTLSHNVLLPPGYQLFLETNFAIHTAAGVMPVSPELAKMARDARAALKSYNLPDPVMRLDSPIGGRSRSILTGP